MKKAKAFHTPSSNKKGAGDFYGSGIKQPMGKIRSVFPIDYPSKSNIKKPPKSLA